MALVVFGLPAAFQQQRHQPIQKDVDPGLEIDWTRVLIVFVILAVAIFANVAANLYFPALLDLLPVIGLAVVAALLVTSPFGGPTGRSCPRTSEATSSSSPLSPARR